jgi:hypothetical protein
LEKGIKPLILQLDTMRFSSKLVTKTLLCFLALAWRVSTTYVFHMGMMHADLPFIVKSSGKSLVAKAFIDLRTSM